MPAAAMLFACGTLCAQIPAQIVAQYYPQYADKAHCRFNRKAYHQESGVYHCMKQVRMETRRTAQGKLLYLLFAGRTLYADSQARQATSGQRTGRLVCLQKSSGRLETAGGTAGDWRGHVRRAAATLAV
ncbi:TPA: hypothetical protein ACFP4Y_001609 [Neisseria bacilliformis]